MLREIVHQFILHGGPIGSRTISKTFPEPLSPASIRNIMADLEEAGYIAQPHASAGRVPTERGYRLYVDGLMDLPAVPPDERVLIARALRRAGDLSALLTNTSHLLSTLSRFVGIVVVPELARSKLRSVDFVTVGRDRVLVILVSSAGVVHQRIVQIEEVMPQEELDRCGRMLSERFRDRTLDEIREELRADVERERADYDRAARRSDDLGRRVFLPEGGPAEVYVDGASNLLAAADLSHAEKAHAVFRALEEKERIVKVLDRCLGGEGIAIRIGSETREPEMSDCSVIASTYRFADGTVGNLGVIGPTRMEYERVVGLVGAIAERLSGELGELGPEDEPAGKGER